jgi:hypothetical protein
MRTALEGLLLFAFIPVVLVLYLRQPLGPAPSIVLGLAIMFGHRYVAAPWMARHGTERCLWCGRMLGIGPVAFPPNSDPATSAGRLGSDAEGRSPGTSQVARFEVLSGARASAVAACSPGHEELAARFLTFVFHRRQLIALGIFVPLVLLLASSLALAAGRSLLPQEWNAWQFRTVVALTVVATSLAYRGVGQVDEPLRAAFPLHNLFLLGIRNTLWVFRIVGAWWLITGVLDVLTVARP